MTVTSEELKTLSEYPFLEDARRYVESIGLTLEKMNQHPVYSAAIELGKQRVTETLDHKFKPTTDDKTSLELLILSYPIARILVSLLGNKMIAERYATAEADEIYNRMRNSEPKTINRIKHDLNLEVKDSLEFERYLKLASRLVKREPKWKLVNRIVDKGKVNIGEGEDLVLLREAVRLKIMEPAKIKTTPDAVKKTVNELKGIFSVAIEQPKVEFLEEKALPKCITNIIALVNRNEANHNSRFILATFLIGLGLDLEDILKIFSQSPKYDAEKTRYQLEFLLGQKGNTKYTCPACITIKSYGLCRADCKVKHPQQYYRQNASDVRQQKAFDKSAK